MFTKKFDPLKDIPDLHGKVIIVTGGNAGIGYATLRHLAMKGAKVYMASRTESKAKAAIEKLEQEGCITGEVKFLHLDLNDPRKAKKAAETFMSLETRLDILVNNASVMWDHAKPGQPKINSDGIQEVMATNHLGPYVFTQTLLPILISTAALPNSDVRIINIGTAGHTISKSTDYSSLEAWNQQFSSTIVPTWFWRYCYSKLAHHLYSNHLARQLQSTQNQIVVVLVHPGAVISDGALEVLNTHCPFPTLCHKFILLIVPEADEGSHPAVFAATSEKIRQDPTKYHGKCVTDHKGGFLEQSKVALDEGKQKELVDFTESLLKKLGVHE